MVKDIAYKLGQYLTGEQIKKIKGPIADYIDVYQENLRLTLNIFGINVLAADEYIRQRTKTHLEELTKQFYKQ